MKIAYNRCFGGFGLSHVAIMRYADLKGIKLYAFVADRGSGKRDAYKPLPEDAGGGPETIHYCTTPEFSNDTYWSDCDVYKDRSDPILIQVIEELGEKANSWTAKLAIEDVPKGTLWRIDEYDGRETVATQDSYDWQIAS